MDGLSTQARRKHHLLDSLVGLTALVLASLALAALVSLRAATIALLAAVVRASVLRVGVRLGLDRDVEVQARLADSADQDLVAVWPLALELLLLVVLGEGFLGDLFVEENGVRSSVGGLAGQICTFDFGVLEATDTVVVVVDGCLEDYFPSSSARATQNSKLNIEEESTYHSANDPQPHRWHCPSASRHWASYQCGHRTPGLSEPWHRRGSHRRASTPRDQSRSSAPGPRSHL
jgi:hypothetical protein